MMDYIKKEKKKRIKINYEIADLKEWILKKFPWDNIIQESNNELFGHPGYRQNQKSIINAIKSKRDVFGCMPTEMEKVYYFNYLLQ